MAETNPYSDIQAEDTTDTREAVRNTLQKKASRQEWQETLTLESQIRERLKHAEKAIAGVRDEDPHEILSEIHWRLWDDGETQAVRIDGSMDPADAVAWKEIHRNVTEGQWPVAERWYAVLVEVAKAAGIANAATDMTGYAPVFLEHLDSRGARSVVEEDEISPIGRLRVPADSSVPLEERAAEIPHRSCDHILTVALPRAGKDSTNARICGNLKDQHGYKWISILDDGRNELPMVAIPNDDEGVRRSLDRVGQSPKAYSAEVFVPAMPGLPDRLPGNHIPFTIGIETLTPELILRLAGISSINTNTERRINRALNETLRGTGSVEQLTSKLREQAKEMEATIQITELADEPDSVEDSEEIKEISYSMDEDEALHEAAQALGQLAGKGLIADRGAETNLDIHEIMRRQERVAVLNCNFLSDGNEGLRYVIMDLWMELIYKARDEDARLPRAAMEIREMKNIAPSKLEDARYSKQAKSCRQTLYKIATQGGSRRVMLVGSTQKLNEVYKAIRQNMSTKVLLQCGEEEINTLSNSYDFSDNLEEQIKSFDTGQGMILRPDDRHWPIQFAGARCGLGDGDRNWLDRYGLAYGARIREDFRDGWQRRHEHVDWWVEVTDLEVRSGDTTPEVNDFYSEWYLLDEDFPDGIGRGDIDRETVDSVLEERREFEIQDDLLLRPTVDLGERQEVFRDPEEAAKNALEEAFEEHDVPKVLRPWADHSEDLRERLEIVLDVVDRHDGLTGRDQVADKAGVASESTVGRYLRKDDKLGVCVVKDEELGFQLTEIGHRAQDIDWDAVANAA